MENIDNTILMNILANSKILYIEDEKNIQEQLEKTLKFFTEDIICASDFNEALKLFVTQSPNIIISDIKLLDKSGIDFAKEVREENKKIPIILLSAFTDQEYLFEAVKLKLVNYLKKPVNFTELSNALKEAAKEIIDNGEYQIRFKNNITYDVLKNCIFNNGKELSLTKKETKLLKILLKNKKRRTSIEEMKSYIWVDEYATDGALKAILSKLRSKIGKDSIDNLSNIGYILITD